jgi:hypothetical protein
MIRAGVNCPFQRSSPHPLLGFRRRLQPFGLSGRVDAGFLQTDLKSLESTYWDQRQNAEVYNRAAYPDVQRILSKVIEGTPQVQTYDVSLTTIHKMAAHN